MRIGIFGGSFNPPHNMHKNIGKELLEKNYLDKVIYVPTDIEYEYKNNLLPNEQRYDMLKLMIADEKRFSVSNHEFDNEIKYTYETLDYFRNVYPNDEIYFICGADNLSYIDEWEKGEYILKNFKIIAITRGTDSIEAILKKYEEYSPHIEVAKITPSDLSSTEIRKYIKEGKYDLLDKFLDKKVINYIIKENLYKKN